MHTGLSYTACVPCHMILFYTKNLFYFSNAMQSLVCTNRVLRELSTFVYISYAVLFFIFFFDMWNLSWELNTIQIRYCILFWIETHWVRESLVPNYKWVIKLAKITIRTIEILFFLSFPVYYFKRSNKLYSRTYRLRKILILK